MFHPAWEPGWSWRDILRLHQERVTPRTRSTVAAKAVWLGDPEEGVDAVAVLDELLAALIVNPNITLLVAPREWSSNEPLRESLDALVSAASERHTVVLLGVEPSSSAWSGGWIIPFPTPWTCPIIPVARLVSGQSDGAVRPDPYALWSTGVIAADGRALLELYERIVPRVVRHALFEADGGWLDATDLSFLDLHEDLLSFAHDLRCAVLPNGARPACALTPAGPFPLAEKPLRELVS